MTSVPRQSRTDPAVSQPAWNLWTLIAALVLGSAATALTRLFQHGRTDADLAITLVIVLTTTSVLGGLSWWLLITRGRLVTEVRGAAAGALMGLLSYFLVFQVSNAVYGAAVPELFGESLGTRIGAGLILSIITLIFSGWFALPLMAALGALLAFIQVATLPGVEHNVMPRLQGFAKRSLALLRAHPLLRAAFWTIAGVTAVVVVVSTWVWTRPLQISELRSRPAPVADYAASVAAIQQQIASEAANPAINPVCRTRLFDTGQRTGRVIVFYHGFTNCPAQFEPLAQEFVARGYNVYIPRMPHHGDAYTLTNELEQLTATELARYADQSVDLAQGLGDEVYVAGLSGGGNVAAWVAQNRGDVAKSTLIAPMINFEGLPSYTVRPVGSALLALPNIFLWWDSSRRAESPGPAYAYPRFSVHAIGELLRLSFAVQDASNRSAPAVQQIVVVTNDADSSVSNAATDVLTDQWQRNGATVRRFVFPESAKLPHDVIDVHQPAQNIADVYPTLVELIDQGR